MERPDFFELKNGEKVKLPFSNQEYQNRVAKLRKNMSNKKLDMILLPQCTTLHTIQVYLLFLWKTLWLFNNRKKLYQFLQILMRSTLEKISLR